MAAPYESIRAFLAVDIADDARAKIGGLIRRLRMRVAHASWTLPENLHLTLRFLGPVAPPVVDAYAAAIRPSFACRVLLSCSGSMWIGAGSLSPFVPGVSSS